MKITCIALLLAGAVSSSAENTPAVSGGLIATASDPYRMSPSQVASEFARIRRDQVEEVARAEKLTVPTEMMQLFECAEKNDWDGTEGAWRILCTIVRHNREATNGSPGVSKTTNDVWELFWAEVMDTFGFAEQVHLWEPGLLSLCAKVMLKDIPPGAILLGGTETGRFVPTAYLTVHNDTNRFVITQNALADDIYMSYLRRIYPHLQIPTTNDRDNVFREHVAAVQSGKAPPDGTKVVDGKVVAQSGIGVMAINGVLARMIFEQNKTKHPFYVEESYVIPWMYPYLSPQGLIMKLNAEPLNDLSPETLNADRTFWDRLATHLAGSITNLPDDVTPPAVAGKDNELLSLDQAAKTKTWRVGKNHRFSASPEARKTFSKMRGAIAGLYAYRRMFPEAEYAFRQAITLCPGSAEANYRLADVLMQQRKFTEARTVIESYVAACDENDRPRVKEFLNQILKIEQGDARRLELESLLGTNELSATNAVELAGIYLNINLHGHFFNLTRGLMAATNLSSAVWLQLADVCTNAPWSSEAADIRKRALEQAASAAH